MGNIVGYKVDHKEQFRKLTKAGDVEIWYHVWATSKGGTYFSIDVQDIALDKADELLTARAKQLDAIL